MIRRFSIEKQESLSKNLFSLKFVDANLKDDAQGLVLNITSDIDDNQISLAVSQAKTAFKIVPGETHHVKLTPFNETKDSSRTYYLDIPKNKNLQNLTFDMKFYSNSSLSYSLFRTKTTLSEEEVEPIEIKTVEIEGLDLSRAYADLGDQGGNYLFKIKNLDEKDAAKLSFRFSINNQLELEENGMISGTLGPEESKNIELMVTESGNLQLQLKTCQNPTMLVYSSSSTFVNGQNKQSTLIINTAAIGSIISSNSQTLTFSKGTVLYLRVENKEKYEVEYSLISVFNSDSNRGLVSDFYILKPVDRVTPVPDQGALMVEIIGPAIDKNFLKALYPNMTELKITLTAQVFIGDYLKVNQLLNEVNKYSYCSKIPTDNKEDYYTGSIEYRVSAENLLESQKIKNITVKLEHDVINKVNLRDMNVLLQTAGSVLAKAKIDVYEDNNFEPIATFAKYSNSTLLHLGTIAKSMPDSGVNSEFVSNMFKIFLLLVTLLVMLAVLLVFYLCANKISGGYKPMSSMEVDPSLQPGRALEMVEGPPKNSTPEDNLSTIQDASKETI